MTAVSLQLECDLTKTGVWVDITAMMRSVDCRRGRAREVDQITAGILTVVFDNESGNFTPGLASGAYYPNITVERPVRLSVVVDGVRTYLFTGTIDSWVAEWADDDTRESTCTMQASDAFKLLARRECKSLYAETVLGQPAFPCSAYYPLSEQEGSTQFANAQTAQSLPLARLLTSKYGAGTFSAGNGAGFMAGGAPSNTYCTFTRTGAGNSQAMTVVQIAGGEVKNGVTPASGGPWTWGVWFRVPVAPADEGVMLYTRTGRGVDPGLPSAAKASFAKLAMNSAGKVTFTLQDRLGGVTTVTSAANYAGGFWHYATASLGADNKTLTLLVDSSSATTVSGTFISPGEYSWFVAGGQLSPWGEATGGLNGSLASIEVYNGAVDSSLGNGIRWLFGRDGFYIGNSTADRIVNLAQTFGFGLFAAPFVVADTANTTQMAAYDITGGAFLDGLQRYAATEQGVLFVRGEGSLISKNRASRVNRSPVFALDNANDEIDPGLSFAVDESLLVNEYAATRPGGVVIRVRDAASVAQNGVFSNAASDDAAEVLLLTTDAEVGDYCGFKVAAYGQPTPRSPGVTVDLLTNPGMWATAVKADIGVRFSALNLPPQAPAPNLDLIVESVRWEWTVGGRQALSLEVSPADVRPYLVADDPVYGRADLNAAFY